MSHSQNPNNNATNANDSAKANTSPSFQNTNPLLNPNHNMPGNSSNDVPSSSLPHILRNVTLSSGQQNGNQSYRHLGFNPIEAPQPRQHTNYNMSGNSNDELASSSSLPRNLRGVTHANGHNGNHVGGNQSYNSFGFNHNMEMPQQEMMSRRPLPLQQRPLYPQSVTSINSSHYQQSSMFSRPIQTQNYVPQQLPSNISRFQNVNNNNVSQVMTHSHLPSSLNNTDLMFNYMDDIIQHKLLYGDELKNVIQKRSRINSYEQHSYQEVIQLRFQNAHGVSNRTSRNNYAILGVRVPSTEHVSEIVGRAGNKIKELREKTGALITTPSQNEEHVFIVEALPEICIRVSIYLTERANEITLNRLNNNNNSNGLVQPRPMGTQRPVNTGHSSDPKKLVLAHDVILVPQELVGKIIGTNGSIIKTIQIQTGTEVKSPQKDPTREPTTMAEFEVMCYSDNMGNEIMAKVQVDRAMKLIAHMVMCQYEKMDSERNVVNSNRVWFWSNIDPLPLDEANCIMERILCDSRNKSTHVAQNPNQIDVISNNSNDSQSPSTTITKSNNRLPAVGSSSRCRYDRELQETFHNLNIRENGNGHNFLATDTKSMIDSIFQNNDMMLNYNGTPSTVRHNNDSGIQSIASSRILNNSNEDFVGSSSLINHQGQTNIWSPNLEEQERLFGPSNGNSSNTQRPGAGVIGDGRPKQNDN